MKVPSCASRVPAACVYRDFSDKVCTQALLTADGKFDADHMLHSFYIVSLETWYYISSYYGCIGPFISWDYFISETCVGGNIEDMMAENAMREKIAGLEDMDEEDDEDYDPMVDIGM